MDFNDEKINHSYHPLGMGSFGAVISPALPNISNGKNVTFPNHVTKIFYNKKNYNELLKKTNILSKAIPSSSLFIPYRRTLKAKQLPSKIRNYVNFSNNNNVPMMHMPNMGISLENLLRIKGKDKEINHIRACSILRILEQIENILSITMKLSQQGYMHGDIHLGNIMFREKDCTLHLIDFDLLDTYDQFYEDHKTDFGFPKDPPECLFLHEIQRLPQIVIPLIVPLPRKNIVEEFKKTTKPLNEIKEKTAVVEYTESLYRLYPAVWSYTQRDRNRLFTNIQSAIIKNASYLTQLQQKNKQLDLRSYAILPYYDNYSIGLCLSEFLLTIYPFPANEGDEDEFLPFLKKYKQLPSKKESHIPFTNRTVYAIRETINLLLRMSHFELQKRPTPMDAYEKMKEILNEYQTEVQYFFSSSLQMTNRNHTRKNRS